MLLKEKIAGNKNINNKSGITLIEVVIGASFIALIVVILTYIGINLTDLNINFMKSFEPQFELQYTIQGMIKEMRSMSQSSVGSYPISQASSSIFVFYSDVDADGAIERFKYFVSGNVLKKGILVPTGNPFTYNDANEEVFDVLHNLRVGTSSVFSYYDMNYSGSEAPLPFPINIPDVKLIKAQFTVTKPDGTATTTSMIELTPRELRDD
ncbi:MAG: hypothetical protein AAB405_00660 [Patescibacteria group bacterium]